MPTSHASRHPAYVEGCFACRVATVGISAAATPTRRATTAAKEATERRWATDHAAYRRLRADGLQPRTSDGAAEVEARAETATEVERGIVARTPEQRRTVREGLSIAADLGAA